MNALLRGAAALGVAALIATGIAWISRAPYDAGAREGAVVRLAWRFPSEPVTQCRRPTAAELERLPVHMRREEVCERAVMPYRMRVSLDEEVVLEEVVHPAGVRGDRPLFVNRDLDLPAGRYRVGLSWRPVTDERGGGDAAAAAGLERSAFPAVASSVSDPTPGAPPDSMDVRGPGTGVEERHPGFAVTAEVDLGPREIALFTYDPDSRDFVVRGVCARGLSGESDDAGTPGDGDRPILKRCEAPRPTRATRGGDR